VCVFKILLFTWILDQIERYNLISQKGNWNPMSKNKILVVDDEEDLEFLLRQKYRMQIKNGEYEFYFAANGKNALDVLQIHKDTHLVVTDINMPEMNGFELMERMAREYPHIKVVVISAYGDPTNVKKAMEKGARDFITKPINFRELDEMLQDILKNY
jgi:adenylate cyclase